MSPKPGFPWPKAWSSIFFKILAVLIVASAAVNAINVRTVRLAREVEQHSRGNYVRKLAAIVKASLGDPPLETAAFKLSRDGDWRVEYFPPQARVPQWSTYKPMPSPGELQASLVGSDWGTYQNSFFFVDRGPRGTLVMMTPPRDQDLDWKFQLLRVGGLILVMLGVWLAVRWLLKPIRWLDQGVERVASGELGHRIPTRENDELGRLAMQFNAMTGQVQSMLEQRRQMLLDVSHELRTPLTRLKLGLEALPDGDTKASLSEDVQELEKLVHELLEGARLAHGRSQLQVEALDLARLVREVAAPFKGREPGLKLDVPESLPIQGDAVRLQRLVQNLLNNAFSHGQPARGPVSLRLYSANQEARLIIMDQGPGVPVEQLGLLFTPFFRSDHSRARVSGGVGLGLPLCLGVARAHGGDLVAALAPGGGLGFTLTLPLS